MKKLFKSMLLACSIAAMGSAAAAPVLLTDAGKLTGANNVLVDGIAYNVKFIDGTCAAVHGTCSSASFVFRDLVSA